MGPRAGALSYLICILTAGAGTAVVLALVLLRFLSSSLLAAMGDACGGIFEASHGFLAASRWNYLLAVGIAAAFFVQAGFLFGGGTRLLKVTHRLKKSSSARARSCPALPRISDAPGVQHLMLAPGGEVDARTVGLLRPRILFNNGLVDTLSGDELSAVLAHEEAHRAGRDNLLVAVARAVSLTLFYLPGPRMALRDMRTLLEKAADRRAASAAGPINVAQALLRIAGLVEPGGATAPVAAAVSGGAPGEIAGRLEALIQAKHHPGGRPAKLAAMIFLMLLVLSAFSTSALAATAGDQRGAFVCFTQHTIEAPDSGVCELDHPAHAGP